MFYYFSYVINLIGWCLKSWITGMKALFSCNLAKDEWTLKVHFEFLASLRYLDLLKDSNLIKSQDVFTVIRYISYNSYGKNMAWNWIQHNWEYLVNRWDDQIMVCCSPCWILSIILSLFTVLSLTFIQYLKWHITRGKGSWYFPSREAVY